eukprot:CAMPEP_0113496628 /NCGR_PEP_ID=MMETSP0014_2-20120614/30219_1 /TAXON_ID=2857 /ORGANISM="Nitzschia sp." /LENGTH=531 /DNA_ID=CAMNT_0000390555 /DNA_START=42 /DNA_END=1637 /DNA_ORIENTATION=+ /assembly_acc=CAM_ASM_000159
MTITSADRKKMNKNNQKRPLKVLFCLSLAAGQSSSLSLTSMPTSSSSRVLSQASSKTGALHMAATSSSSASISMISPQIEEIESSRTLRRSPRTPAPPAPRNYYGTYLEDVNEDGDSEGEGGFDEYEYEVSSFQQLQKSMGPEVLDETLQQQISDNVNNPTLFLNAHVKDASQIEKIAMSSIPEQLPQPAVNALTKNNNKNNELRRSSSTRLNHEEEIELGKMIQHGVALHKIKTEYEAKHAKRLSRSEWAKIAPGVESASQLRRDVASYRRAKQLLVSANIGLVHAVVKKQYSRMTKSGISSFDELVQEGSLGLMRAAELFDPSKGLRFSTYATIWIKGALSNSHATENIKIPDREKTKWNKITKAHAQLVEENGLVGDDMHQPSLEQVAERVGMTVDELVAHQHKMKQVKLTLSLDYDYKSSSRSGTDSQDDDVMEKDKSFQADADLAERIQMQADILEALAKNLNPREARLMRLRYGLTDGKQRTIKECAESMGIGQSYAQNLNSSSLKKLRKAADLESLEEYLLTMA